MTDLDMTETVADIKARRKHPHAHCEDCPLYEIGNFVPSIGPEQAKYAFVGEAPGVQEARIGIPFSGPSGRLLDGVMKYHGIKREESLLTNACLCRPPDNATPAKSAILACRPRLDWELEDRGVETAVALGNSAAQALLDQTGVTKLRIGPAKESRRTPGLRVIPTLHPAAALRQPDMFPHIVTDIGKLIHQAPKWEQPLYTVSSSESHALFLIEFLSSPQFTDLVIDIECDIDKDTAHDHPNFYKMLCIGVCYQKGRVVVFSEGDLTPLVLEALGDLFRSKRLTCQNGKFDLAGLYPLMGPLELFFDTMLASYACDERPGIHSLDYMGIELLGTPDWKHQLDKYEPKKLGYGVIPRPVLYHYNALDCSVTWDLKVYFEKKFEKHQELRKAHDLMVKVSNQLMYLELNGIKVDKGYLTELEYHYIGLLNELRGKINELVKNSPKTPENGYDKAEWLNPNSPMQIQKYLVDRGVQVLSTDADTMTKLKEALEQRGKTNHEVYKFIELLMTHRTEAKMYGTYVKGIRKRLYGGRVYTSYRQHGTVTGRLASRNPNLLNITRGSVARKLFIPAKPEFVMAQTDYSQAELRVLTWFAQEPYFQEIFADPSRDVFDELTPQLYPGATKDAYLKAAWKELRIRVKAFVYGLGYGRSAFSVAMEFKMSPEEGERMKNRFFSTIPKIVEFQNEIKRKLARGQDLVTPYGRHRRFMLVTDESKSKLQNEALAFMPQSTASDMCLEAFVEVRKELKGWAYVRNVIYDAILYECHPSDLADVSKIVEGHMIKSAEDLVGGYVKFDVDTTYGESWGAC